jgi:hypothetical protein
MNKKVKTFIATLMTAAACMGSMVCYASSESVSTTLDGNQINGNLSIGTVSASAVLSSVSAAELSINGYAVASDVILADSENYIIYMVSSSGGTTNISANAVVNNQANEMVNSAQCTFAAWYGTASWSKFVSLRR